MVTEGREQLHLTPNFSTPTIAPELFTIGNFSDDHTYWEHPESNKGHADGLAALESWFADKSLQSVEQPAQTAMDVNQPIFEASIDNAMAVNSTQQILTDRFSRAQQVTPFSSSPHTTETLDSVFPEIFGNHPSRTSSTVMNSSALAMTQSQSTSQIMQENVNNDPQRVAAVFTAIGSLTARSAQRGQYLYESAQAFRSILGRYANNLDWSQIRLRDQEVKEVLAQLSLQFPFEVTIEATVTAAMGHLESLFARLDNGFVNVVEQGFRRLTGSQLQESTTLYDAVQFPTTTRQDKVMVIHVRMVFLEGIRRRIRDKASAMPKHMLIAYNRLRDAILPHWEACKFALQQIDHKRVQDAISRPQCERESIIMETHEQVARFDAAMRGYQTALQQCHYVHRVLLDLLSDFTHTPRAGFPVNKTQARVFRFEDTFELCEVSNKYREEMVIAMDKMLDRVGQFENALIAAETSLEGERALPTPSIAEMQSSPSTTALNAIAARPTITPNNKRKAKAGLKKAISESQKRQKAAKTSERELKSLRIDNPAFASSVSPNIGDTPRTRRVRAKAMAKVKTQNPAEKALSDAKKSQQRIEKPAVVAHKQVMGNAISGEHAKEAL